MFDGLADVSCAGSGFMGKPEKDACSGRRMVRLNMRCSTPGPLPDFDSCSHAHM